MNRAGKALLGIVGFGASLWSLICLGMYLAQDALVFPAPSVPVAELDARAQASGARTLHLTGAEGTPLYGWHRPAQGARALIYCHGNAETVGRVELHDLAASLGFDTVVVAYAGYPGSGGVVGEPGVREAADAAWRYATETLGLPPSRVVAHGKSLGGGACAWLAENRPLAGLVLESTYTSIPGVAADRYPWLPVFTLLRTQLNTGARAPKLTLPALVLHADGDPVIGVHHGRALAERLPKARYIEVQGRAHSELLPAAFPEAGAAWRAFLAEVTP